ncbi:neuronal PAS domain-containing protein 4 [Tiliqua scincoides]|uniref:neuronal PAS domain-containing protein 4 n=1 Tax=Tiliqua scincoides TaxID=71010 RepID=UPI0034636E00
MVQRASQQALSTIHNTRHLPRSTKSASKARRDQINAELQILRSLLPISKQEKERLSYLHTMALVCFHIRQTQLFLPGTQDMMGADPTLGTAPVIDPELLLSLPGFILALTATGRLAYISENVSHYLGFSVVELLAHGDSIFDLLTSTASKDIQEKLCFAQQYPGTEIEFITEMRTLRTFRARYGRNRIMAVRGRFRMLNTELTSTNPALTFIAFCTPVGHLAEDRGDTSPNSSFQSQHTLDMKIVEVTESVTYYLGYQKAELIGQSWYSFLHPEDIGRGSELHRTLVCGAGQHNQQAVVRVLCKDLSWAWVQIIALKESGKGGDLVTCINHILSEEEALYIQSDETQHRAASPTTPTLSHYAQETEHQIQPKEASLFPQEPVMFKSAFCSDSSPSVDFSPLSEETPSTEMFPAMGTSSDPDRKGFSMLAEQIYSLAEIFSQYTKEIPQGTPSISLQSGRPAEDTNLGPRLGWGTSRTLNVPEGLPMDEEIISGILNNLLDNDILNLPTCELGSPETFNMANSELQLSLLQIPQSDGTPYLDQCLFRQSLSSSDFHVPESQWDGSFHPTLQQGAFPEETVFC